MILWSTQWEFVSKRFSLRIFGTLIDEDTAATKDQSLSVQAGDKHQVSPNAAKRGVDTNGDKSVVLDNGIPIRAPNHNACSDNSVQGIYHIAMGDIGGAAGTIFFQFAIAQILYAERNNLKPWVYLNNVSYVIYDNAVHDNGGVSLKAMIGRNATYFRRPGGHRRDATPGPPNASLPIKQQTMYFDGTGVWEHYFEPISDFIPGDRSCESKLYVTMDLYLITPGLHGYADYAPRCWRYKFLPDYIAKPHLSVTEWLEPQRKTANAVIQKYIHPRNHLKEAANKANPNCSLQNPCLGLHIRHSDKASGRRVVKTAEFLPYVQAFLEAAKDGDPHVYLATDSSLVLQEIADTWPKAVRESIRTIGDEILRSSSEQAVFDMHGASKHHRANQEILTEIIALSACQFMIHGFSAVSESAIWINFELHDLSVNLEDPDCLQPDQFAFLVEHVLAADITKDHWPRPIRSDIIWPELFKNNINEEKQVPTNRACERYNAVLRISNVGQDISAGGAFFSSILNQLVFAENNNLLPWVHLQGSDESNRLIYDKRVHGNDVEHFKMVDGMSNFDIKDILNNVSITFSDADMMLEWKSFEIHGNGIWNSYFEPVSDFVPGDKSCLKLPLLELKEDLVRSVVVNAKWAIRAWKYDNVADSLWWNPKWKLSMNDLYETMRSNANQIIKKYYRVKPFIARRAEQVNPSSDQACLGLHLRNGDKTGNARQKISPKHFLPYLLAFERAGGRCIFLASDSHRTIQFVTKNFPQNITDLIRSQGRFVVRSSKLDWPAHYLEEHHRVNSEVLVDILALSKCRLMLHGFSTVSEAAIYLNPALHNHSLNLEDPRRRSPEQFEEMAREVLGH
jgi:hypothetical protein